MSPRNVPRAALVIYVRASSFRAHYDPSPVSPPPPPPHVPAQQLGKLFGGFDTCAREFPAVSHQRFFGSRGATELSPILHIPGILLTVTSECHTKTFSDQVLFPFFICFICILFSRRFFNLPTCWSTLSNISKLALTH